MATLAPDSINHRFTELLTQLGLTKNAFAMSLGKTASVIQHLIDGRNKPGYDLLYKVFEVYPNVSRDWLMLGQGPMLLNGAAKSGAVGVPGPEPDDVPLEPIDLSEIPGPATRRTAPAARLQPDEIAATLALAASAGSPARTTAPPPPLTAESAGSSVAPVAVPPTAAPVTPASAPAAATPAAAATSAVAAPAFAPDAYLAAMLNAQHLQHQLALAELRNQHLLEQQALLREMLDMARKV